MILEALVPYYMAALSKHDLKPSSKFKTFLLGFAGCCFLQKLPREGRLKHEPYVSLHTTKDNSLKKRITNDFIESQKAIYDIGTKFLFGSCVRHKPIKNWEIENVKVGFLKLSSPTIRLRYQNVI